MSFLVCGNHALGGGVRQSRNLKTWSIWHGLRVALHGNDFYTIAAGFPTRGDGIIESCGVFLFSGIFSISTWSIIRLVNAVKWNPSQCFGFWGKALILMCFRAGNM